MALWGVFHGRPLEDDPVSIVLALKNTQPENVQVYYNNCIALKGLEQDRNHSYHAVWHIGCMASSVDELTRSDVDTIDVDDCMDELSVAVVETKLCFVACCRRRAEDPADETNCVVGSPDSELVTATDRNEPVVLASVNESVEQRW
jgi:hypothetical protein